MSQPEVTVDEMESAGVGWATLTECAESEEDWRKARAVTQENFRRVERRAARAERSGSSQEIAFWRSEMLLAGEWRQAADGPCLAAGMQDISSGSDTGRASPVHGAEESRQPFAEAKAEARRRAKEIGLRAKRIRALHGRT